MPRRANCCQLCNWEQRSTMPNQRMPKAVALVAGLRLCKKHLRLVRAIAKDAGRTSIDVQDFAA